jgi:hypothetical protein
MVMMRIIAVSIFAALLAACSGSSRVAVQELVQRNFEAP